MNKVYCIKKVYISDGLPELDTEVYATEEARDKAWNVLVHDHNNMIQEAFDIRLSYSDWEGEYYYNWDDKELEFYCKADATMHHDYFEKSEETVND